MFVPRVHVIGIGKREVKSLVEAYNPNNKRIGQLKSKCLILISPQHHLSGNRWEASTHYMVSGTNSYLICMESTIVILDSLLTKTWHEDRNTSATVPPQVLHPKVLVMYKSNPSAVSEQEQGDPAIQGVRAPNMGSSSANDNR